MYTARHARPRRRKPVLATAGVAVLALATAGTLLATSPSHAATARPVAPSFGVGLTPDAIAVATYAHRAYVATNDTVVVVDTSSHENITAAPTGLRGQTAIGLVQAGAKAYVGSFANNKLAVFDPATNTVTGTIRVGKGTTDITDVVTTRGDFAYVTQYGQHTSRVTIVNARTDKVVGHIHVAGAPQAAVQTPDLSQVWIGNDSGENIKVINPRTMKVTRTIPMPRSGPVGCIAFNVRGTTAYVTGLGGVTAVNVANGHTRWFGGATRLFPGTGDINTGPVVAGPHNTLLVVNSTFPDSPARGTLTTLDRSSGKVLGRTTLGNEPTSMALDPMGRQVLVTNYADGTVSYATTRS